MRAILTACTKKSLCSTLTTPKLVNLNTRSIIHMMFGKTSGFELKQAINNGTSAVLWWLASSNVRVPFAWHTVISSPDSTTINHRNGQKIRYWIINVRFVFAPLYHLHKIFNWHARPSSTSQHTYCRSQPTMAMSTRWPIANGKTVLLFCCRYAVDIVWAGTVQSSISHTLVYSKRCSQWQPLYELWLLDRLYIF